MQSVLVQIPDTNGDLKRSLSGIGKYRAEISVSKV